jgi:uncharacterized membrane protein YfcA
MFGIGGGGMSVPLLYIAFGLPIVGATSTSLLIIAPTAISGSIKHIRQKTVSMKTGLLIGGFGAVASVGGSLIAGIVPPQAVSVLTAAVILFSGGMMLRTLLKDNARGIKKEAPNDEEVGSEVETFGVVGTRSVAGTYSIETEERKQKGSLSILLALIIGLIAGSIAGIVGVGGGFIIVPVCVAFLGFPLKKAAGTSLVAIAIIAIPGIISHALLGHIYWLYGLAVIVGTIPGAQLGSWLIARLPERPMRFAFIGLLASMGLLMILQEFIFAT